MKNNTHIFWKHDSDSQEECGALSGQVWWLSAHLREIYVHYKVKIHQSNWNLIFRGPFLHIHPSIPASHPKNSYRPIITHFFCKSHFSIFHPILTLSISSPDASSIPWPPDLLTSSSQASNGPSSGYAYSLPSTPVVGHRDLRVAQGEGGGSINARSLRNIPRRPSLFKVSRRQLPASRTFFSSLSSLTPISLHSAPCLTLKSPFKTRFLLLVLFQNRDTDKKGGDAKGDLSSVRGVPIKQVWLTLTTIQEINWIFSEVHNNTHQFPSQQQKCTCLFISSYISSTKNLLFNLSQGWSINIVLSAIVSLHFEAIVSVVWTLNLGGFVFFFWPWSLCFFTEHPVEAQRELSQQRVEEEIRRPVQQWHAVLPLQLQCKETPQSINQSINKALKHCEDSANGQERFHCAAFFRFVLNSPVWSLSYYYIYIILLEYYYYYYYYYYYIYDWIV